MASLKFKVWEKKRQRGKRKIRAVGLCVAPAGLHKADYLGPLLCFLQESTAMEGARREKRGCSLSQAQVTGFPENQCCCEEGTLQLGFTLALTLMLTLPVSSAGEDWAAPAHPMVIGTIMVNEFVLPRMPALGNCTQPTSQLSLVKEPSSPDWKASGVKNTPLPIHQITFVKVYLMTN